MRNQTGAVRPRRSRSGAFTLIELLVVVAIIAVLISILLPSLAAARAQAKATVCATNNSHVSKAMAGYLGENNGIYPPSYVYPKQPGDSLQDVDLMDQPPDHPYGYVHWSYYLYSQGEVSDDAFQCPEIPKGGMPRTNPGSNASDWQAGQVDQDSNKQTTAGPNAIKDRQAAWMSLTGNAAIFPRNKFTHTLSGGQRANVLVTENKIEAPGDTILLTEFNKDWRKIAISISGTTTMLSKSHRPVNPFYHVGYGSNEYAAPEKTSGFIYGTTTDQVRYGLMSPNDLENRYGVIESPGLSEMNAVGRHHPGSDKLGGTANFLYVDGHVERKFVVQTLRDREWGSKYYSLSGANEVLNRYGEIFNP